jgi:hypothetical protein
LSITQICRLCNAGPGELKWLDFTQIKPTLVVFVDGPEIAEIHFLQ